jgi:alkylation response protein AidB-like acyl-CoA dehydrogenase
MNLLPSEDQRLVVDAIAGVIERLSPFQRLFGAAPDFDAAPLSKAAAEGGWYGLSLPEEAGGIGYTIVEEVLLARELGRAVAPLSIHATSLAAFAAHRAGDDALAARLARGDAKAGFAVALGGRQRFLLLDWDRVDYALLFTGGTKLIAKNGLSLRPASLLDPTTSCAEIAEPASASTIDASDTATAHRARLIVAAHMIGLAERARDMAVEHAKSRVQFGRPIGSFQAVKHRCSQIATHCELSWSQICGAAAAAKEDHADAAFYAAAAYSVAEDTTTDAIRAAIQIHGGMGVTAEHALHILLKRHHSLMNLGLSTGIEDDLLAG